MAAGLIRSVSGFVLLAIGIFLGGCADMSMEDPDMRWPSTITFGTLTDSRDGNTYKTVQIGTQTWMAENLAYLPLVSAPVMDANATDYYYYVYDYGGTSVTDAKATSNYSTYGVLYNWTAALTACPSDWHLPTDAEWTTLTDLVGSSAGTKLKAMSGWYDDDNGIDVYGFSALPGGYCYRYSYSYFSEAFNKAGSIGNWWSATESNSPNAYVWSMRSGSALVDRHDYYKGVSYSVRCLKDYSAGLSSSSEAELSSSSSVIAGNTQNCIYSATNNTLVCAEKTYKTVEIGTQTWMAENLNYAAASGSWCYDGTASSCAEYGRLYDWSTALTVCPEGWHLPTDAEWITLTDYAGGEDIAGTKLRATSGWNSINGTDAYGFSALPGGSRYPSGKFKHIGDFVGWWSATESNSTSAYPWYMYSSYDNIHRNAYGKEYGFSVRCLKG